MGDIKQEHDEPGITFTTIYGVYDEGETMDEVHACRVCLLTDCKLYPLVELTKENSYTQVSGLSLHEDDGLPRSLCAECYTLLNKCMQFREKSRTGYQCLMKIFEKHSKVTVDIIKKVNRKKLKLNSNLTILEKKPQFDYQFVDETDSVFDENKIKQETIVEHNTNKDVNRLNAMNDDTKYSTECDITETTINEIDVPFKTVKKRKTKHIKDEKITFENVVTDNVCIDIDENLKVEPVTSVVRNHNIKAKDELKRSKHQRLKEKDNNKRKQTKKTKVRDYDRMIKENFTIKALSIEEQKETMCKKKTTDNYVKSAYKCDYCFKGFLKEPTYKSHMLIHTEKFGKFVCEICHKHWTNKYTLHRHMGQHTHLYACVSCTYTTQSRCAAKLHLEWHKGKKYKCDLCEVVFLRATSLFSHLRIQHPTDHVCHICGYSFLGENGLNAHCKLKHREDSREVSSDSPRCAECDITFTTESALETHLKVSRWHASLENLKRNDSYSYVTEKKSVYRRRTKVDVPRNRREAIGDGNTVTCKECGLQFCSRHALHIHMSRKHPASIPVTVVGGGALCDVCGRVFNCEALLRDHALVHSESASYSCSVCGKSCKTRTSLQLHSRLHIQSYPCPRCDKIFNHRFNRDRHLTNVHSDIRDVKCDFCEKFFKSDEERKSHTDHVHLKKPWPKRNRDRRGKDGQTVAKSKSGKGTTADFCAEQAK